MTAAPKFRAPKIVEACAVIAAAFWLSWFLLIAKKVWGWVIGKEN